MDNEGEPFWNFYKILIVVTFVLGVILGGIATNQVIDPYLMNTNSGDFNKMIQSTERLDSRVDELYNCLLENDISPATCN